MCMLLSWAVMLTNWFQQSNAHTLIQSHNPSFCSFFSLFLFSFRTYARCVFFLNSVFLSLSLLLSSCRTVLFFRCSLPFSVIFFSYSSQLILKYTVHLFINVSFLLRSFQQQQKILYFVSPRRTTIIKKKEIRRERNTNTLALNNTQKKMNNCTTQHKYL